MLRSELEKMVEVESQKYFVAVFGVYHPKHHDDYLKSMKHSAQLVMDRLFPVISELQQENKLLKGQG